MKVYESTLFIWWWGDEDDSHIGHAVYHDVDDGHVSHDDGRYDGHDCVGVLFKLSKVAEMAEK